MYSLKFMTILTALQCQLVFGSSICVVVTMGDPDDLPLRNARIEVALFSPNGSSHYGATTDMRGKACIDHLPEGLYYVDASADGFLHGRYYPVRVIFPKDVQLTFRLPLGEVHEGGLTSDVTLSGTLTDDGKPAEGIKICLFPIKKSFSDRSGGATPPLPIGVPPYPDLRAEDFHGATACTVSNDLGQYVLVVFPGVYRVLLSRLLHTLDVQTLDVSYPGAYHDKVSLPPSKK